jgi:hypothetical protein
MNAALILMVFAIVITIIAVIVYNVYTVPKVYTFAKSTQSLSIPTVQIGSDKVQSLLEKNEITLSMYAFVSGMDRTQSADAANASRPLLEIPGVLSFEVAPFDAYLSVKSAAAAANDMILHLPMLPEQKWVYLTILQSGRKFDVMYNGKIVGSKVFDQMPAYAAAPLRVGDASIRGTYIYGNAVGFRRTKQDVSDIYAKTSDTRGEPLISLTSKFMSIFNKDMVPDLCPPGVACKGVSIASSPGMLNMWETNYA